MLALLCDALMAAVVARFDLLVDRHLSRSRSRHFARGRFAALDGAEATRRLTAWRTLARVHELRELPDGSLVGSLGALPVRIQTGLRDHRAYTLVVTVDVASTPERCATIAQCSRAGAHVAIAPRGAATTLRFDPHASLAVVLPVLYGALEQLRSAPAADG